MLLALSHVSLTLALTRGTLPLTGDECGWIRRSKTSFCSAVVTSFYSQESDGKNIYHFNSLIKCTTEILCFARSFSVDSCFCEALQNDAESPADSFRQLTVATSRSSRLTSFIKVQRTHRCREKHAAEKPWCELLPRGSGETENCRWFIAMDVCYICE